MAKNKIERFYTIVKQEGLNGATRGKVPVALCQAIGAGDGDVIEWEISGGTVVGGHTLTKSEKREYERENKRATPAKKSSAPTKASKKKSKSSKPVVKSKRSRDDDDDEEEDRRPKKKGKKSSKRATKVSYDEPKPKKKGLLKGGKIGKKKR